MKKYVVNTNSAKVHLSSSKDGRCKLALVDESNRQYYDSLEEAMKFPNEEKPKATLCTFCLKNR